MAAWLLIVPAQARPRDDVMAGAFQCAAIGDTRAWLDCYYGAAQPARAALDLRPAPASQVKLHSEPAVGNVLPADRALRDGVMAEAFQCNKNADDRAWLDCYYQVAQPVRVRLGLSSGVPLLGSQSLGVGRSAASVASQASNPGAVKLSPPGPIAARNNRKLDIGLPPGIDQVDAHAAMYHFDKFGVFTVTLDNGQIWRQISGDTVHAHWNGPAANYVIHVTHGFLGSYNLQVKGLPGLYKVLRIQ